MPDINHAGSGLIFKLESRPPFHQALVSAITHLLAIFVPMATPVLIAGVALQLSVEATAYLVSMAVIASGIGTWLQVNRYGIIGSGLFSIQLASLSFVTVVITLGNSMESDGFYEELIMSSLLSVSFAGVFLVAGSSFILSCLYRVITPTISGIVALIIGLSLIKVGTTSFGGGFVAKSSGAFDSYERLGIGLLVLAVMIGFNYYRSPSLRMGGIVIGLCVDYIASSCLGMMDSSSMRNLPLITILYPFKYGSNFSFYRFLVVDAIYLLSALEAASDITVTATISRRPIQREEYQPRLKGDVLADGLVFVIASAAGSLPLTTLAQSNGVIQMTGVALHYTRRAVTVMLVILGLFPMIGGFFTAIPSVAPGGATTLMFSMVAVIGIRIIITSGLKRRETFIIATSLSLGLGVPYNPEIFKILPASVYVLTENPICAGGSTATLLNIILPNGYRQEDVLPGTTSVEEMD